MDERHDPHGDENGIDGRDFDMKTHRTSPTSFIRSFLPPLNFITLHYAYFIGTSLLASAIFYASSNPHGSISYVDSLFLVVSAITEAGLNTVNLSQMTVWQQVMLWLLIIVGSTIWISIWTVAARKHVFEKKFKEIVDAERERDQREACLPISHGPRKKSVVASGTGMMSEGVSTRIRPVDNHITFEADDLTRRSTNSISSKTKPTRPWLAILSASKEGRNSQFHSLTAAERSRLGGHEYRALRLLSVVVPLYSVLCHVLGGLALGAWIANNMPETATSNGANPWWAGIFFAVSAFNNSGMSLLDANVVPFQQAYFVLITMGFLILAGNTAYPLFLRLIFWSALKVLRLTTAEGTCAELKSTLEFILKYPRRVYTNLFPSRPTWWLFFMVVLTNGIDWMAFEVLNIGNPVIEAIPVGARVLDGLFQALAVRSGGFYLIPISSAYPGLQVLYVIMMYISVYPVVITMRHSNVYEERSLGIYADDESQPGRTQVTEKKHLSGGSVIANFLRENISFAGVGAARPAGRDGHESRTSFVSQQIRGQLAHDLWLLTLAVLVIVTIETSHFLADPVHFSVFNVVFEVVSAYGCVGISVGLPNDAMSFSGGWHAGKHLVMSGFEEYSFYDAVPAGKWTRILLLEPGAYDDPIRCSLYLTPFQSAEYEAISYVWGNTQDVGSITCQGLEIDVTANLVQSLRQVRYRLEPRHLWVDALCINQRNLPEKAFHVNMMGEIYSHASRVVVCLGDDGHNGESAQIAFDVIRDYNRIAAKYMTESRIADGSFWKPKEEDGGYGPVTGERLLHAVRIFKKPWFGRVWVLQEVGLAYDVLLAYGNSTIDFTEIMDFALAWCQTGNDFEGVYFSSGWISGLFDHVWATYAPNIDFSWYRSSHILTTSARNTIQKNEPKFEDVLFKARHIQKATDPRDFVYAFLGHPLAKSADGKLLVEADYTRMEGSCLEASVYAVDEILLCGDVAGVEPSQEVDARARNEDAQRLATETALSHQPSLAEKYWAIMEATERDSGIAYQDKAFAFASTLLHSCDKDDQRPASVAKSFSDFCKTYCPNIQSYLEEHAWLDQWAAAETHFIPFIPRTASSIKGERFFTTKKGYCGTSTPLVKPGDLICIIPSVQTPLVIRRVEETDDAFRIIGSSYVYGMMYGEAFKYPGLGNEPPKPLVARFV
ncbi:hypothetical protein CkaCkLH20_05705 [Colletotrichum karsti]|uniref:Heterokaryon incompatibility domain-containing protein n=1 Tax=Colletotrichum karsti TaxID=1095194 RepID=A0A9P6I5Z2_9PEZI|nr:uncharacterized protein CkaCkLH20_05705 [Colletotrichum karsti]KAF9876859.1 hypothetical protein CkaCkLH20_05705 [Colletotrichum karsti]